MLAREVIDAAGRRGHEVEGLDRDALDITDPTSIDEAMESFEPEAVINCAAYSDVDRAEDDERAAMRVNDSGAALLAAGAARIGAAILYPSSDYVFDGAKGSPYLEDDMPAPLGAYGRSKLGGEVSVAAANPRHFIVRSSWLFGVGGKNFVETMLRIGRDQPEVLVVSDQRGCPTSCADLADAMVRLLETHEPGIHHIRGGGECTWFDFAQEIFDQAEMETRVMAATTDMMARKARRPAYSVLGHGRDDAIELPAWQRSLRRYLDDRELVR